MTPPYILVALKMAAKTVWDISLNVAGLNHWSLEPYS